MNEKNIKAIKELLRANPDGLSVPEMTAITGIPGASIAKVINAVETIYTDRWKVHEYKGGQSCCWVAAHCLLEIPEKPPRPAIPPKQYLLASRAMQEAAGAR